MVLVLGEVEVEMVLVTMLCVGSAVTLSDVTSCPLPAGTAGLTSSSSSSS